MSPIQSTFSGDINGTRVAAANLSERGMHFVLCNVPGDGKVQSLPGEGKVQNGKSKGSECVWSR